LSTTRLRSDFCSLFDDECVLVAQRSIMSQICSPLSVCILRSRASILYDQYHLRRTFATLPPSKERSIFKGFWTEKRRTQLKIMQFAIPAMLISGLALYQQYLKEQREAEQLPIYVIPNTEKQKAARSATI